MPGPLDLLRRGFSAATTPLVSKTTREPVSGMNVPEMQDAIDSPSLNRPKWLAQLQGFHAGSLEGLRGMTSPLDLVSNALPAVAPAMRGVMGAGRMAKAAPTLDLIEPAMIKQVAPAADDVTALLGDMQRNLARVPTSRAKQPGRFVEEIQSDWPAAETLGERAAEFTPMGGEAIYNAGRPQRPNSDVMESLYQHLMRSGMGGRGR